MQHSLFDTPKKREIYLQGGYLYYWSNFLDHDTALYLFEELEQQLPWEQPSIKIAGKRIAIPRKQVWMGDNKTSYVYSGQRFEPLPWHPDLWQLKQTIQQVSGESFNSVLCNLYRDGQDSVAWHADDEPELGEAPVIASYSLGAPRKFQMRLKGESKTRHQMVLAHNSLLLMGKGVQEVWQHQLPKTKTVATPRINLTFRYRIPD